MNHVTRSAVRPIPFTVFVVLTISVASLARANTVVEWNSYTTELVAASQDPANQTHTLALVQIAVHDALNAIDPRYATYAFSESEPNASDVAAIAAATRDTLVQRVPVEAAAIDARYASALAAIPDGDEKDRGIAAGQRAAAAILELRKADDLVAAVTKAYQPKPPAPEVYQVTPPLNRVLLAGMSELSPFASPSADAYRSPPPPSASTREYAAQYDEVMQLGRSDSKARTPQQTETASFWYDAANQEWYRAAHAGLAATGADAWESARVLALLSIAMFDGVIASVETKFAYEYWRPITAIQNGDADGNASTAGDPSWQPLCVTPPFPEYNSTHAVTAAAAATILASELGDDHTFTVQSPTLPEVTRTYRKYTEAAAEEALSRIYCGIHFRGAMLAGLEQGRAVAQHTLDRALRPRACEYSTGKQDAE